ncbi:hypothetical protein [Brevundimonas sp.]|uniref:hypothetical protein n=1 Tax=Brevundimonas sp. TaxID=1871086 RepID=UPI0028A0997D|nr:hypothetical protein [Brevundimonas sp.]
MALTRQQLASAVSEHLGDQAKLSGSVLSVSATLVRPGRFYIMGLNPGGDPGLHGTSILQSLEGQEHDPGWSAHTHDCWKCDERPVCQHLDTDGCVAEAHLLPHQKRVQSIYAALGAVPGQVLATNAVFARSTGEDTLHGTGALGAWEWWEMCWPIHQRMLAEVRPEWIVTLGKGYGTSAFGFLMDKAKVKRRAVRPLGSNDYSDGRIFAGELPMIDGQGLPIRVLGLPHPSYYGVGDALRRAIKAETGKII